MKINKTQKSSAKPGIKTVNPCQSDAPMAKKTTGTDTIKPSPQLGGAQELCGFDRFLQTWLAEAKQARELQSDLPLALLTQILWETCTLAKLKGITGACVEWSCSLWSRFGSQAEIHAALQKLGEVGIIRLVPCSGETTGQDKEMKFMLIELPWLDEQEE